MTISTDDQTALRELDARLKIILPEEYRDSYETVQPVSMGSAGLKYAGDGTAAWDEMWGSFCDLAMAGGPPHKGKLLGPASRAEIDRAPERYNVVVDEICRGITMVTDLPAYASSSPGWARLYTYSDVMAGWLLRAITMENVAVRAEGKAVSLPAGPEFRIEKEIKNVITVIAKTCHYWLGHMPRAQKQAIGGLFAAMAAETPLVEPLASDRGQTLEPDPSLFERIATRIHRETGLQASSHQYAAWIGLECPSVDAAVWMMRAMVAANVLSRRENLTLFIPVNPASDPDGERASAALVRVHRLLEARQAKQGLEQDKQEKA